jgi:HSP20 family protein
MNLVRYSPNRWFDSAFNRMVSDFFPAAPWEATSSAALFNPPVDVRDDKEGFVVSVELPGIEKEDLKVEVVEGVLTLSGIKKQETVSDEEGVYRAERSYGEFKRAFVLPDSVDAGKIDAQYRNGVLTVTLPKKPEAAPKQIAIRGDESPKKIGVH